MIFLNFFYCSEDLFHHVLLLLGVKKNIICHLEVCLIEVPLYKPEINVCGFFKRPSCFLVNSTLPFSSTVSNIQHKIV